MKWLVVLAVILAVIGYFVYRYRKYLQTAIFMFRTVRKMRQSAKASKGPAKQVPPRDTSMDSELYQCPQCGKYSTRADSVKLKGEFYCSHECMEEALAVKMGSNSG